MYQTGASHLQTVYKFIITKKANQKSEVSKGPSRYFEVSQKYIIASKHTNFKITFYL